jgi:ABC-type uncharacterized transport system ATPase subunit
MVGRKVIFQVLKKEQAPGEIVLDVKGLSALNNKGFPALKNLSFNVRKGEILGLAGVAGNGQSELAEVITGLRPCTGSIKINGKEVANHPPKTSIDSGVSHIPEDRTGVGSAPNLTITENMIMKNYAQEPIGKNWKINFSAASDYATHLKDEYGILAPSVKTQARKLSGGNLQKLILAREISGHPILLVAMQPTRGLDVGAIEAIQKILLDQRENGAAILLISEELEELLSLSDRIAVICSGELMGVVDTAEANLTTIGLMMTGSMRSQA